MGRKCVWAEGYRAGRGRRVLGGVSAGPQPFPGTQGLGRFGWARIGAEDVAPPPLGWPVVGHRPPLPSPSAGSMSLDVVLGRPGFVWLGRLPAGRWTSSVAPVTASCLSLNKGPPCSLQTVRGRGAERKTVGAQRSHARSCPSRLLWAVASGRARG